MISQLVRQYQNEMTEEAKSFVSAETPFLNLADRLNVLKHYPLFRAFPMIPIVDTAQNLVGWITLKEFLEWNVKLLRQSQSKDLAPFESELSVAEIMSSPRVTVEAGAPLDSVIRTLLKESLPTLPVTENGKLVGIISFQSIFKALRKKIVETAPSMALHFSHIN